MHKLENVLNKWSLEMSDEDRLVWEKDFLDALFPLRYSKDIDLKRVYTTIMNNDKAWKVDPGNPFSLSFYENNFDTFIDFFARKLRNSKNNCIKKSIYGDIIIPNECDIESYGKISDIDTIIRMKKPVKGDPKDTVSKLEELFNKKLKSYSFINMKLLLSYYHRIHIPCDGKITSMVPIVRGNNFFGDNCFWFVTINNKKLGDVFLMLVGESDIQDFTFFKNVNEDVKIFDELGHFSWGSQTILFFPKELKEKIKGHYFVGDNIII